MSLNKELEGLTVVSLEQAVAAPYCGLLLADAGARVIKVEKPDGDFARFYDKGADGESAIFAWLNRGKESIALNLKSGPDALFMRRMLGEADVFLSNLAPGATRRMGLSGDELRKENPGLITCTISGYGEGEEHESKKAYDFLVQGEAGVCAVTGTAEQPVRVGVSLTDLSSGLTAFSAILRALIQRGRTGKGADLSISMFDVMADWMNMPLILHRFGGGTPERAGLQHSFLAPYGAFKCKGGDAVLISIQSNREWRVFCNDILESPELVDDPRYKDNWNRCENRKEVDAIVNAKFEQFTKADMIKKLDEAKIANSSLNSVPDVSAHPLLRETTASFGNSHIDIAALPLQSKDTAPSQVPGLDEHGRAIRAEFG